MAQLDWHPANQFRSHWPRDTRYELHQQLPSTDGNLSTNTSVSALVTVFIFYGLMVISIVTFYDNLFSFEIFRISKLPAWFIVLHALWQPPLKIFYEFKNWYFQNRGKIWATSRGDCDAPFRRQVKTCLTKVARSGIVYQLQSESLPVLKHLRYFSRCELGTTRFVIMCKHIPLHFTYSCTLWQLPLSFCTQIQMVWVIPWTCVVLWSNIEHYLMISCLPVISYFISCFPLILCCTLVFFSFV